LKNNTLIEARKRKGYTQKQLADMLGCQKSTISNWENGHSTPSLTDAYRVALVLDSDIHDLFLSNDVQDSYTSTT
jgi:DNA-binding XRE family transcriptional regulator